MNPVTFYSAKIFFQSAEFVCVLNYSSKACHASVKAQQCLHNLAWGLFKTMSHCLGFYCIFGESHLQHFVYK
jgi:hypothetical protein